jgi:hypothetical protein
MCGGGGGGSESFHLRVTQSRRRKAFSTFYSLAFSDKNEEYN